MILKQRMFKFTWPKCTEMKATATVAAMEHFLNKATGKVSKYYTPVL